MLTESPEEIFLRFERPKSVWFELAYVKSCQQFLGFRCNAFDEDPDWQLNLCRYTARSQKSDFELAETQ